MSDEELKVTVSDGKYTFVLSKGDWRIRCLRNGEPWLVTRQGHNAVSSLLQAMHDAEEENTKLKKDLSEKGEYGYSQHVVDALTRERDSLKEEVVKLKEELTCGNHLLAQSTDKQRELEIEVSKLKNVLRDFGGHRDGCPGRFPPHKCTCGWDRESMTIDSISASNRRHVVKGVKRILQERNDGA